jgi:hypothetical protein
MPLKKESLERQGCQLWISVGIEQAFAQHCLSQHVATATQHAWAIVVTPGAQAAQRNERVIDRPTQTLLDPEISTAVDAVTATSAVAVALSTLLAERLLTLRLPQALARGLLTHGFLLDSETMPNRAAESDTATTSCS